MAIKNNTADNAPTNALKRSGEASTQGGPDLLKASQKALEELGAFVTGGGQAGAAARAFLESKGVDPKNGGEVRKFLQDAMTTMAENGGVGLVGLGVTRHPPLQQFFESIVRPTNKPGAQP